MVGYKIFNSYLDDFLVGFLKMYVWMCKLCISGLNGFVFCFLIIFILIFFVKWFYMVCLDVKIFFSLLWYI